MAANRIHYALIDAAAELIGYDRATEFMRMHPHDLMHDEYLRGIVEMIMQSEGCIDRDHVIAQILAKAVDNSAYITDKR